MRGDDHQPDAMFSYVSPEQRVPSDHPLRVIRLLVDEIRGDMSREFDKLYAVIGRPLIPSERLLRAQLLQIFYSILSERLLMDQLDYNMLFTGLSAWTWTNRSGRRPSFPRTVTGSCVLQFNGRRFIRDRYPRDEAERVRDLARARGNCHQLPHKIRIWTLGRDIDRQRREPFRRAIQRARHDHVNIRNGDLTGANRRQSLTCETATQQHHHVPSSHRPRSRPPLAVPRSTRSVCPRTVALDVVWLRCSIAAVKVVLIYSTSRKEPGVSSSGRFANIRPFGTGVAGV